VVAYQDDDNVIIFNFSTPRSWGDQTCIVKFAEYVELDHDSAIVYALGELCTGELDIRDLRRSINRYVRSVPETVLKRIVQGAAISPRIPEKLQKFFLPKPSN
jgi:hypothetical protein